MKVGIHRPEVTKVCSAVMKYPLRVCVCVCVHACVCVRARVRVFACVRLRARACIYVYVYIRNAMIIIVPGRCRESVATSSSILA